MARETLPSANPLIDQAPSGTISRCRSVLAYVANATQEMGGPDLDYGRFLILECVVDALKHAENEISKPALEVVRG